ncbi:MAG: GNAT family N-acetyltransferase [Paracoccaceae bacterium]|nr:GNAT family N-acetyltransferase [Paracoccaceae bacterium]
MTPEDMAALHAKAFSATRAWSVQEFADLLGHSGTLWRGNRDSFILMRIVADEAEVLTIATDPAKRRQGLARAALKDAENAAALAGAREIFLEVAEDNLPAQTLYKAENYHQVGRRPGYYLPKNAAPVAALVLRKDLKTN